MNFPTEKPDEIQIIDSLQSNSVRIILLYLFLSLVLFQEPGNIAISTLTQKKNEQRRRKVHMLGNAGKMHTRSKQTSGAEMHTYAN